MAILGTMTQMAQGELRGRWAFGLPTGMGKTKSIEAWIATVNDAGLDHVSVAVAASKVEALCEMKRSLLDLEVPATKIGLIHSKRYDPGKVEAVKRGEREAENYATEPSEGADRQFMLVPWPRLSPGPCSVPCPPVTRVIYQGVEALRRLSTLSRPRLARRPLYQCLHWPRLARGFS